MYGYEVKGDPQAGHREQPKGKDGVKYEVTVKQPLHKPLHTTVATVPRDVLPH